MHHKNIPFPEVIHVDEWFYIEDDKFGSFQAYTKEGVLNYWKDKVSSVLIREAIEEERYTRVSDSEHLYCTRCGAVVYDIWLHEDFTHKN